MDTEDKQELKLLRSKVKYLEDRIEVMAKSIGSINKILGRFQMTEGNDLRLPRLAREFMQQDEQSNDPFIRVMESGESDKFRDSDTMIREDGNELI